MFQCSSASRKFLNRQQLRDHHFCRLFQCSSASRKFLNSRYAAYAIPLASVSVLFSEPKIPQFRTLRANDCVVLSFQCSSASRKFLNNGRNVHDLNPTAVSVLFSEPKIPQYNVTSVSSSACGACFSALQRAENSSMFGCRSGYENRSGVSVLFSEPKIPQSTAKRRITRSSSSFSALQRAENSSIPHTAYFEQRRSRFQCSSASRKFLNAAPGTA